MSKSYYCSQYIIQFYFMLYLYVLQSGLFVHARICEVECHWMMNIQRYWKLEWEGGGGGGGGNIKFPMR